MLTSDFNQDMYLVLTTEENENNAYKIGDLLLADKLTPCVTYKNIESHFWWEGKINQAKEVQLTIKCKVENVDKVCHKISEVHSYEVPEIIYFSVSASKVYHQWINSF